MPLYRHAALEESESRNEKARCNGGRATRHYIALLSMLLYVR